MASIKKRSDGKWRARYRDEAGKEHSRHFERKADGQRWLNEVTAATVTGQYVDPRAGDITVAAYAREWAASRPHNARTARRVASAIKNHVADTKLGARPIKKVSPSEAQAWATGRAKVLAPSTCAYTVYLVRSIFTAAVLDLKIPSNRNPFAKTSMPKSDHARIVPLTVDQVRTLAAHMPNYCRAMVIVQAGLGLRVGELLALRVHDVDFLRRAARVETQIPPNEREREDPKTPLSKRSLPLPAFVADALAAHIAEFPPLEDGSLFYNSGKRLWTTSHYGKVFIAAAGKAGMPKGTTSHDLRHHYASVLLHAGESVVAVAERLGHKNASLVLKVYGHLMPDSEERTRKALDSAWRAPADQVRTSGSSNAV
ncbi:tyrosine-type recombinase/integrase [Actinoplanes sp. CA-051413]|uniref:tyrosine-type recombinase/integrase n=1 Tax=Actinoplanes sp. CA-051413 TaxID=3239899 RepID=UPI003D989614